MIEELNEKDYELVCNLGKELHENFDILYSYKDLCNGINKTYIIKYDGVVSGFIHVQNLYDEVDIIDIFISEGYRNKGLASQLINDCFSRYYDKRFILEVSSENIPAINLYKKLGFRVINIRKKYYNGIDAYVMEKR